MTAAQRNREEQKNGKENEEVEDIRKGIEGRRTACEKVMRTEARQSACLEKRLAVLLGSVRFGSALNCTVPG